MTTYDEWRVTGTWNDVPYERVFSPVPRPWRRFSRGSADPEAAARWHVAEAAQWSGSWGDGPHLHRRTVTVTDWQEIEP